MKLTITSAWQPTASPMAVQSPLPCEACGACGRWVYHFQVKSVDLDVCRFGAVAREATGDPSAPFFWALTSAMPRES